MTRSKAEIIIAKLDNLEERCRDIEVGISRIRREFQDTHRVKTWDYDPSKTVNPSSKQMGPGSRARGFRYAG